MENQHVECHLRAQVEKERKLEPVHPVIGRVPESDDGADTGIHHHDRHHPNERRKGGTGMSTAASEQSFEHPLLLMPDSPREVLVSPGLDLAGENGLVYSADGSRVNNDSDFNRLQTNAPGMPRYRRNNDDDLHEFTYGCGSALFGKAFHLYGSEHSLEESAPQPPPARPLESASPDHHFGSSASPARPPQNQAHVSNFMSAGTATPMGLSASFDTVDWRTGLSGHRGLSGLSKTSPRSNPNSASSSRNTVRMMSVHSGIGSIRARHSNSPSSSPALVPIGPNNERDEANTG